MQNPTLTPRIDEVEAMFRKYTSSFDKQARG
jgi:hypothetical protein